MDEKEGAELEQEPNDAPDQERPHEVEPPAKRTRTRTRKIIVASGIAVVLIAAGVGFFVWHEQPRFCSAICHTPMDSYVEGYYSGDASLLSATHEKANVTCLQCHESKIDEQVTEAAHWVTGDYAFDEDSGKLLSRSDEFANKEMCLNKSCHNMSLDDLAQSTSTMAWNPHDFSEHGAVACGSCHKVHGQSTIVCSECHKEATKDVPAGWSFIPYGQEK